MFLYISSRTTDLFCGYEDSNTPVNTQKLPAFQVVVFNTRLVLITILAGDFHQFPPVVSGPTAPLYYPSNTHVDNTDAMIGREIYEQFLTVVQLQRQIHVEDPVSLSTFYIITIQMFTYSKKKCYSSHTHTHYSPKNKESA